MIRDMNLDAPATDARRIEVLANGLPLWQGAVDTTLVTSSRRKSPKKKRKKKKRKNDFFGWPFLMPKP